MTSGLFSTLKASAALLLLGSVVGAATASANTTVVALAAKDAMIFGTSAGADTGNASGKGPAMFAGADGQSNKKRGLITFNLAAASIPSNATIVSATLSLVIAQIAGSGGGSAPSSYPMRTIRVMHLTRNWGEGTSGSPTSPTVGGTGQGYTRVTGDSSWSYAVYSGTLWTTAGGDFSSTAVASVTFNDPFSVGQVLSWSSAGMASDVQAWLATPANNFGWQIKSDLETSPTSFLGFWTKDGATANSDPTLAPKLTIVYSTP